MQLLAITALMALMAPRATGHSWVEQMQVVDENGNFTGNPGYPRGYFLRGSPGFNDDTMTVRLPGKGTRLSDIDMACSPAQSKVNSNTASFPQLVAQPGNFVAMKYLENGHVTLPQNQLGKPGSGGLVYIYATTNSVPSQKVLDVMTWTPTASLDSGRLLAINSFDDGRCYQINPNSPKSLARQKEFPNPIPGQPGTNSEQWCETNFVVPSDAAVGTLSVYWVWQWPTLPDVDPNLKSGKDETYTTCADIQVVKGQSAIKAAAPPQKLIVQDPQSLAVPNFQQRAANVTFPSNPSFVGPNNPDLGAASLVPSAGAAAPTPLASAAPAPVASGAPAPVASGAPAPVASGAAPGIPSRSSRSFGFSLPSVTRPLFPSAKSASPTAAAPSSAPTADPADGSGSGAGSPGTTVTITKTITVSVCACNRPTGLFRGGSNNFGVAVTTEDGTVATALPTPVARYNRHAHQRQA